VAQARGEHSFRLSASEKSRGPRVDEAARILILLFLTIGPDKSLAFQRAMIAAYTATERGEDEAVREITAS
jgi:hypothetical protein